MTLTLTHTPVKVDTQAICFVAPKAYSALVPGAGVKHIGGAEMQQAALSRGLSRRGHSVSCITLDHGQDEGEDSDGVIIHKAYKLDAGLPILRFAHPRITKLWSAMKRADADIYYQRTSDSVTGIVAAFCRTHGRKFVYGVAHDADTIPQLPNCPSLRERVLYRYGLHHASLVIAQTQNQREALRRHFSVDSIVIHNALPIEHDLVAQERRHDRPIALWVGRFAQHKRLEWLFDVARLCPEVDFRVCGDGNQPDYVRHLHGMAEGSLNVTMMGSVSSEEMIHRHYAQADALLCTSAGEGFPNTFLEAWSLGVPVVTTFDPDGLVVKHNLGFVANDVNELARGLRRVCADSDHTKTGKHLRAYVRQHHSLESRLDRYEEAFREA